MPDEGPFTLVSHAFGTQAIKGAVGIINSSEDVDRPVRWDRNDPKVIEMVGNSFVPKRVEVPVGSEVTFINEDVFDMLEGELTGKYDAVTVEDGDYCH